jgi:hypothetical protein
MIRGLEVNKLEGNVYGTLIGKICLEDTRVHVLVFDTKESLSGVQHMQITITKKEIRDRPGTMNRLIEKAFICNGGDIDDVVDD